MSRQHKSRCLHASTMHGTMYPHFYVIQCYVHVITLTSSAANYLTFPDTLLFHSVSRLYQLCIDRRDHRSMTVALRQLHWLPIRQRIQFKVLTLMHGAVHNRTPRYLSDRIVPHAPSRSLRSATKSLVAVPRINLERYGRRSFSCAGPTLWNALPLGLRTQQDPDRFRRDLKTHLFNVASS